MKIRILGTAAGEGVPSPFCTCATCSHARAHGGRNLRLRTAALIDDELLVDCGPDLVAAMQRLRLGLARVTMLLVTHAHSDHWQSDNLLYRHPDFCPTPVAPLSIYGPPSVTESLSAHRRWPTVAEATGVRVTTVSAGDRWEHKGYAITALPATHAGNEPALLYVIDDGEHKLFYGTDTGPLNEEAWALLAEEAPFDLVLMDETMGTASYAEHQSFETFLATHERFVDEGLLTERAHERAEFVAFHFSHQSNPPHTELETFFEPHGIRVAYDGLELVL